MKVIIFGASGKTGQHAWQQALQQGHDVTAFVRSPQKIEHDDRSLHVVKGDVFDANSVSDAVLGHDAAVICLGSTNLKDKTTVATGTRHVVDGMVRHGVERLVIISAAGTGESWTQIPWSSRLLFKTMLRNVLSGHQAQEAIVKSSPLDWTIVRAAVLTDKPASGSYTASNTAANRRISRADLADFLIKQVTDATYSREAISVTS